MREDLKGVEWSWWLEEVPKDWKRADITCIFKEGKKEDPGKYRAVDLTIVPGKVMKKILLQSISTHIES